MPSLDSFAKTKVHARPWVVSVGELQVNPTSRRTTISPLLQDRRPMPQQGGGREGEGGGITDFKLLGRGATY